MSKNSQIDQQDKMFIVTLSSGSLEDYPEEMESSTYRVMAKSKREAEKKVRTVKINSEYDNLEEEDKEFYPVKSKCKMDDFNERWEFKTIELDKITLIP